MAISSPTILSSSFLSATISTPINPAKQLCNLPSSVSRRAASTKRVAFSVRAAKLPPGVVVPKVEPKFQAPFAGFTKTAETWNSRACMIGLTDIEQGDSAADWSCNWKGS